MIDFDKTYPEYLYFISGYDYPTDKPGYIKKCVILKRINKGTLDQNEINKFETLFKLTDSRGRYQSYFDPTHDLRVGQYLPITYLTNSMARYYFNSSDMRARYFCAFNTHENNFFDNDRLPSHCALYRVESLNAPGPLYESIKNKIIGTRKKRTEYIKNNEKIKQVYSNGNTIILNKEWLLKQLTDEIAQFKLNPDRINLIVSEK